MHDEGRPFAELKKTGRADLAGTFGEHPARQLGVTPPMVKNCTLRNQARFADPERAQLAVSEPSILSPVVVAGQVDVFPLER